jgi:imidazolonepropionase-like amidohydrolase
MSTKVLWSALLLLAMFTQVSAQQSPKRIIVRAGKLLDVKSGKLQTNQDVVIEGDKIVSIGPASETKASPRDTLIDLSNSTVLPGLIDAHTHLTFNPHFGYETLQSPCRARP